MISISRQNKLDKKGLSEIIAYVLLISITIALSVIVYGWLKFYVSGDEVVSCDEGVNLIIKNFDCYGSDNLTITLENKGRFSVDGFVLRVHNRTDADFGFYILNETDFKILPALWSFPRRCADRTPRRGSLQCSIRRFNPAYILPKNGFHKRQDTLFWAL